MQTYLVATASGQMRTHIPPVDMSTPEAWADSLVRRNKAVIEGGFGLCHDGKPYDLNNYLADMAGDIPWDQRRYRAVYEASIAHPEYQSTRAAFDAKYGEDCGISDPDLDF